MRRLVLDVHGPIIAVLSAPGRAFWGRISSPGSGTAWPRHRRGRRRPGLCRRRAPFPPRPCRVPRPARRAWAHATRPPLIWNGSLVRRWPSCQIQWVSMAVMLPGAAAATWVNMASETSKWLLEWLPQRRPRSAHIWATRTLPAHGPEMRIGQGNVHRAQLDGMHHLAEVGGDHVGGGGQAGGAAEFRHDLAARIAGLRRRKGLRHRPGCRRGPCTGRWLPSATRRRWGPA